MFIEVPIIHINLLTFPYVKTFLGDEFEDLSMFEYIHNVEFVY